MSLFCLGLTHQICNLQLGDALNPSSFSPLLSRSPMVSCSQQARIGSAYAGSHLDQVSDERVDLVQALNPGASIPAVVLCLP